MLIFIQEAPEKKHGQTEDGGQGKRWATAGERLPKRKIKCVLPIIALRYIPIFEEKEDKSI